jgi:hypothetical protein
MAKTTNVAMVNGPYAEAGFSLASACDLRFAAESVCFTSALRPRGPVRRFRRNLVLDADSWYGAGFGILSSVGSGRIDLAKVLEWAMANRAIWTTCYASGCEWSG